MSGNTENPGGEPQNEEMGQTSQTANLQTGEEEERVYSLCGFSSDFFCGSGSLEAKTGEPKKTGESKSGESERTGENDAFVIDFNLRNEVRKVFLQGSALTGSPVGTPVVGDADIGAGHVGRYISLANPDALSKNVCYIPFGIMAISFVGSGLSLLSYSGVFMGFFVILSLVMFSFCMWMGFGTLYGYYKMRQATKTNWTQEWEDFITANPGVEEGMLHLIVLPNYKEDESMLSQTVSNLAQSPLATKFFVVVLAMEAREGIAGQQKAERLINRHSKQFKHMFATYHPTGIPCEVAGKSSNSQWAFREVQRWYGGYVSRQPNAADWDMSKTFLTVADADSLHNRDYFTNLSLQGLSMSQIDRSWTIWQAPILLLRNYETVPGLLRTSAYGTFLFEIAGLATSSWHDHTCFSAYSMSLSLANHPMVDGWDADVIAEDHHMYLKCMFASYWEEIFAHKEIRNPSKLKLKPIWNPVTSYLAEDSTGAWASIYARFQQARRHSQGVAELSYMFLQYFTILQEHSLPWRCHLQIGLLLHRLCTVHLWNTIHSCMAIWVSLYAIYWSICGVMFGEFLEKVEDLKTEQEMSLITMMLVFLALFAPSISALFSVAQFLIVKDSIEGKYCPLFLQSINDKGRANKKSLNLSPKDQLKLFLRVLSDTYLMGHITLTVYGTIPEAMASWSLAMNGHRFEYIVAAKPDMGAQATSARQTPRVSPLCVRQSPYPGMRSPYVAGMSARSPYIGNGARSGGVSSACSGGLGNALSNKMGNNSGRILDHAQAISMDHKINRMMMGIPVTRSQEEDHASYGNNTSNAGVQGNVQGNTGGSPNGNENILSSMAHHQSDSIEMRGMAGGMAEGNHNRIAEVIGASDEYGRMPMDGMDGMDLEFGLDNELDRPTNAEGNAEDGTQDGTQVEVGGKATKMGGYMQVSSHVVAT